MQHKCSSIVNIIAYLIFVFIITIGFFYYLLIKYTHRSPAAEPNPAPTLLQADASTIPGGFPTYQNSPLPKYSGYIVRLKNVSIADNISSLQEANKGPSEIARSASSQLNLLLNEHKLARSDLRTKLGTDKIIREYLYSYNGFFLSITDSEAEKIKTSSYVSSLSKNVRVQANLMNSVPLIGADRVWTLTDTAGRKITGRGTRIAVIDTGIDYTHPDLGHTSITDRNFQKVTTVGLDLIFSPENNLMQSISYDGRYLAYPNKNAISIYDSVTGQTEKINLYIPKSEPIRVAFQDNKLIYYSTNLEHKNPGIYYYNRVSKVHQKIAASSTISRMSVEGSFFVYNRGDFESNLGKAALYGYDLASNNEFKIADNIYSHAVFGNQVAFPQYNKIVLYDLPRRQKVREIASPDVGDILDFNKNYIIYSNCTIATSSCGDYYYLYDLISNRYTPILKNPPIPGGMNKKTYTRAGVPIMIHSNLLEASIGDGVIFLRKSYRDPKIMMYDLTSKRIVQMNIRRPAYDFTAYGNKTCFMSSDVQIYCHSYDSQYSYPLPAQIFNSKVVGGYDFVNNDSDPLDDFGHGTHVAAIAAGNGGFKGVAPGSDLIAYKVLDYWGSGFFSDIIAALDAAVQTQTDTDTTNDIDVANVSLGADCKAFGGYSADCGPDDPVSLAVDSAMLGGVTVVVAAGNSGDYGTGTIGSPGTSRKAITVGSVNKQKQLSYFSSKGPVIWNGETIIKPDVVSPGEAICAAQWSFWLNSLLCLNRNHISISGTSMAAPHVAGVASLLNQKFSSIRPARIKSKIKSTAVNLGYDINKQGNGLVDAYSAVVK